MNKGMKKLTKKERRIYISVASCFFILLSLLFTYLKPFNTIDYLVSDFFYQQVARQKEGSSNIKIISIDSKTTSELGNFKDWSRSETAKLVELLNSNDNNPDVIAFGLDYHNKMDSAGDNALIETCKKYENICISSSVEKEDKNKPPAGTETGSNKESNIIKRQVIKNRELHNIPENMVGNEKITGVTKPYEALLPYITTGIINTDRNDDDGYVRNTVASINYEGEEYDSFALAVYKMHLLKSGKDYKAPIVGSQNEFGINYSENESNFNVYSFYDVINGNIDASIFDNSIVLVGDYTTDDKFNVPNHRASQMEGIELQANIINALLQNNTIQYAQKWFLSIWYSLYAILFLYVTSRCSGLNTIIYSAGLIAVQILLSCLLNVFGYYIPLLRLIVLIVSVACMNLMASYIIVRRQRSKLESVFKKYVDEQVVNEIVNGGEIEASIGGTRKDIAVLFVDIRGFTPLSEKLSPEHVVEILNRYLTIVADAVFSNGGTLDKFIGDAAMAVYNSPSDLEDYVFRAVCTAWDILSNAAGLKKECIEKYGKEVEFGIGVNCGDAVIGNIGSQNRMEYTAIGDTVNTTSRLEGVAKAGQILISNEVAKRLGDRIDISYAGDFSLKGKKKKVTAFEINGIKEEYKPVKRENPIMEKANKIGEKYEDKVNKISEKYEDKVNEIKKASEKCTSEIKVLKEFTENELRESMKQKRTASTPVKGGK